MFYYSGLMLFNMMLGVIRRIKDTPAYMILTGIILTLVSGLRHYTVGVDSRQYYYSYQMISRLSWGQLDKTRYEFGYSVLCKLFSYISSDPQILFLLTSAFINGVILWFIYQYSPSRWISVFLYVSMGFFYDSMNILRQSIAMCIILLGIPLLLQGKWKHYIGIVLLAAQFHNTAYVALLIPMTLWVKSQKNFFIGIGGIGIAAFIFGERLFRWLGAINPRYFVYVGSEFAVSNYFATVINGLIVLVILLFYLYVNGFDIMDTRESIREGKSLDIQVLFLAILMLNLVFQIVAVRVNIFERLAGYYAIFSIIILPHVLVKIEDIGSRRVFGMAILMLTYMENMIILYYRPYWTGVIPYRLYR